MERQFVDDQRSSKLYLHVGRHKCGTSTLQHFLCASESELARHGFRYPEALRAPVAHHPVAHFYNPRAGQAGDSGADAAAAVAAFWQQLRQGPKAIVSSEAFQNLDPHRLCADLAGFDLTVLVYLREPLDYLLSAYAQRVKGGGGTETLDAFAERFRPDYRLFLTSWQDAFPDAHLRVRVFEREQLYGQDIRRDFLHGLGLDEAAMTAFAYPETDSNVSIGGSLLEFVRRVNLRGRPAGAVWHAFYKACQGLASSYEDYRLRPGIPRAMQEEIRARHAESLCWLSETYFGGAEPFRMREFPAGEIDHSLTAGEAHLVWQRLRDHYPEVAAALGQHLSGGPDLHD